MNALKSLVRMKAFVKTLSELLYASVSKDGKDNIVIKVTHSILYC